MSNDNNFGKNVIVGILVIIVLFFISQSLRGSNGGKGKGGVQVIGNGGLGDVYNQILNLAKQNQAFLSFQKDLIQELTNTGDKLKALDEFSIVIDQSLEFEGYNGYTGSPYNVDFKTKKFI